MTFKLSQKSLDKLNGVHEDLKAVVEKAITISKIDFRVLEGLRSVDRQKELVAQGKSLTMMSRHLTGHAVDLGAIDPKTGELSWEGSLYDQIANAMMEAAAKLNIPLRWGGTFKGLVDKVHFELPKTFEKYKGE